MCAGGKHPGRSLKATNATGQNLSRLFYVTDCSTGSKFLVDTGTQVSIIPPSPTDRRTLHTNITLEAVYGTSIKTFGTRSLTLNLGLRRTFRWVFIIAETATPIIGADFLRHYQLLVDMTRFRHGQRHYLAGGFTQPHVATQEAYRSPARRVSEYHSTLQPGIPRQTHVTHHITTVGPPVSGRTRRLAPERLQIVRKEFQHMLELGIIRPSSSSTYIWY